MQFNAIINSNIQSARKLAVEKWRAYVKNKKLKKESREFENANQDLLDLISYSGLKENSDHLELDGKFVRTLFISGYPFVASTGWLSNLVNFNDNIDVSYHIEQVDALVAIPKLTRKITELESRRRSMVREGKIIGSELLDPLESATSLKESILRGQEKLFQVSIYATIFANTLTDLNKTTSLLEVTLATKLFYTKSANYQQLEGFQSTLPRGENILSQKRNLDSSSAALTFPFMSSELVQESGILYGINKSNNSLVIIDRFALNNANSITFAQSGAGKSYTAKIEILRQLMQKTRVIVIDPEREYHGLAKSLGGTYLRLSAKTKEKINPFDFAISSFGGESNLSEHIQDLTEIISLIVGGTSADEKASIDVALIKTYKNFGWSLNGKKKGLKFPLLKDFYKTLKAEKQNGLAKRLEKYVTGSLSEVFNSQTNIKLDNNLVVFDIKDLPESLRQIMIVIVANFVYNVVKKDPRKRLLVIDEGWMLLAHNESAAFVSGLVRRARKYFLGVNIISQQANDFLNNDYGRAIASQTSLRILMRQDTTTIKNVVREFKLSEYEEKFLLACDKGEAIVIADQNHVAVKIVASEAEHPIITTNPQEVFEKNK